MPRRHPPLELLADFLEGRLSSAGQEAIERHLSGCPICAGEVAQLSAVLDLLRAERWVDPPAAASTAARAAFKHQARPLRAVARWQPNRLSWAAAAAFAVLLIGVVGLLLTSLQRPAADVLAQSGTTMWRPSGQQAWRPVTSEADITAGNVIRTGGDASMLLDLSGLSQVSVAPESEVEIVALQPAEEILVLSQSYGLTQHVVRPLTAPDFRYEVRTPAAVITVVGTSFFVEVARDGTTTVTTTAGEVHVEGQGEMVAVTSGQTVSIAPGRPPAAVFNAPKPLPTLPFPAAEPTFNATQGTPTIAKTPTLRPTYTVTPTSSGGAATAPAATATPPLLPPDTAEPEPEKTKQTPPGQTKTPQPPGQTRTPWPPPSHEAGPSNN